MEHLTVDTQNLITSPPKSDLARLISASLPLAPSLSLLLAFLLYTAFLGKKVKSVGIKMAAVVDHDSKTHTPPTELSEKEATAHHLHSPYDANTADENEVTEIHWRTIACLIAACVAYFANIYQLVTTGVCKLPSRHFII